MQGIWQNVDYSDVNTVCRNSCQTCLATGNDDQVIRLFRYPVVIDRQIHREYFGHSSHVTKVRFNASGEQLVSIGGNDRTILIWRVKGGPAEEKRQMFVSNFLSMKSLGEDEIGDDENIEYDDHEVDYPRKREVKAEAA